MSGFRGLFVLSPILLIAALGYLPWWRSGQLRFEWALAVFASLGMLSFNASSAMWWGGFAIGPRYFLPGLPFLALGLAFALREWSHRSWVRGLLIAAAAWSLIATWGLTLAGQAFPSDTIRSPLLEYAWPNWLSGNIARNLGTMMGLPGASSLLPLLLIGVLLIGVGWGRPDAAFRRSSRPVGTIAPSQGGPSPHEEAPAALSGDRRPRGGGEA
jgi:branched-subunit amino acid ABC-type transport system permease component